MAQKVTGYIKLQIPAAKATASPPVGPALGQHGVNISQFIKEFNERTKDQAGFKIPVVITVYADRSFSFITKTPSFSRLSASKRVPVFPTRTRSLPSPRRRFRRSPSAKCPT